jgi:hypothetical protein
MMPSKNRPHVVQTTLNDQELRALREQAESVGLTVTAFIRQLVIREIADHLKGGAESS